MTAISENDSSAESTEILRGSETVMNGILHFLSKVKNRIDSCGDPNGPSIAIGVQEYKKLLLDIQARHIKFRYITDITKENIHYCKELMKFADEIRHLDGIKANFSVSETEYMAYTTTAATPTITTTPTHEKRPPPQPVQQVIYSNVKDIVEQQKYVFQTFWSKAIPAEQRIKEIEEGFEHPETKVLKNKAEIFGYMKSIAENANKQSTCCSIGGMQLVYNYFFNEYKKIVDRSSRRKKVGNGVRWITSIDKDSKDLVKIFLNAGMQVRHVKNLTHVDFAVDNKNFNATIDKMEGGKLMENLLISNEPAYVNHFNSVFEELWKNGIDATERIRDIEAGVDLADIEVIPSSAKAQERYLNVVRSAEEEILWIFPTVNAFIRQNKIGAVSLGKEAAKEKNVRVRILMPASSLIEQKAQELKEYCSPANIIDVRYIVQMSETKATILVVDRKVSLVMELKDDTKSTFYEAIGLSTYSNSKAGVLSYVAIFENLWKQSELYEQLVKTHEQLKMHDKMQREFINIASHEMKTPTQAILGYSDLVQKHPEKREEMLNAISRNAIRLQKLTNDILDVTRIESQTLSLNKEVFNLNDLITSMVDDCRSQIQRENSNVKILYNKPKSSDLSVVEADIGRITQAISNLLSNAIKFSAREGGGIVSITINEEKNADNNQKKEKEVVIVSIKDNGEGIHPEILPRLFTKFATRSFTGTGLGLFITKSIIEAHGGKIWAENNKDEKVGGGGATFSFSLPLSEKPQSNTEKNQTGHK